MTDVVDPATRSGMMSGIGGRNTKPKLVVRRALFVAGWRVLVVWECATRSVGARQSMPETLRRWINGAEVSAEFCCDSRLP